VRDDLRYNKKGNNQANQLNKILGYKHCHFIKTMDVNKVNKTNNPSCYEGLAVLSNVPIINYKRIKLKKHSEDKYSRAILSVKFDNINIFIVHYSPDDLFSRLHLQETLDYAKKIKPLIIGDFNIKDPHTISELIDGDYIISTEIKKYVSYPSENITLDYFLIPKKIKIKSFKCIGSNISDHKAFVLEI
ncbi:endonuclease/exonuclease/phosphatase family protein, partial [Nanoarchaeota archaeon]